MRAQKTPRLCTLELDKHIAYQEQELTLYGCGVFMLRAAAADRYSLRTAKRPNNIGIPLWNRIRAPNHLKRRSYALRPFAVRSQI